MKRCFDRARFAENRSHRRPRQHLTPRRVAPRSAHRFSLPITPRDGRHPPPRSRPRTFARSPAVFSYLSIFCAYRRRAHKTANIASSLLRPRRTLERATEERTPPASRRSLIGAARRHRQAPPPRRSWSKFSTGCRSPLPVSRSHPPTISPLRSIPIASTKHAPTNSLEPTMTTDRAACVASTAASAARCHGLGDRR